jgi:hypothetical protein
MNSRLSSFGKRILKQNWIETARCEQVRIRSLLSPATIYQDRNHPIYNFIFIYFFFNQKILFQYSPGMNVEIEMESDIEQLASLNLVPELQPIDPHSSHYFHISFQQKKITKKFLQRTLTLLKSVESKLPSFWCFGLHEWAMLYHSSQLPSSTPKPSSSLFQSLPLRVTAQQIESLINPSSSSTQPSPLPRLRCTHFDAIRFFTPSSLPLNAITPTPTRKTVHQFDQPGCVHVNMDLFKYGICLLPSSFIHSHHSFIL